MIDFERCEDIAWERAPLPTDSNPVEALYTQCCWAMYDAFNNGKMDRAFAEEYKMHLRREVQPFAEFWDAITNGYNDTALALAGYKENPCTQTADALASVCERIMQLQSKDAKTA